MTTKQTDSFTALTRGKLAKMAGIGIEAIRFYEQEKLLPKPARSPAGYRQYSPDAVKRILFIKQAKELGFSLKEIAELLSLRVHPRNTCEDVKKLTTEKIASVAEKIHQLRKIKGALEKLAADCRGEGPLSECPILEALERQTKTEGRKS